MKFRLLAAVALVAAAYTPAAAQSVSGLSTKRPEAPVVKANDAKSIKTLVELASAIAAATTAEQRDKLVKELGELSAVTETGTSVNLAVPAGATASVGENGQASAGPRLGFQAWKPDDFFAGAFFTFDTAPKLTGDVRKAGQFVRDPPNTGSSFLVSGNRMFLKYRCGRIVKLRPARLKEGEEVSSTVDPCDRQPGDKQDALIIGVSARVGASTTTLEHTRKTPEGEKLAEPETHEASIFHGSLSLLLTSRTFKTADGGEYQFGFEVGRTLRKIGGDASANPDFLAQPDVLGHPRKKLASWDMTFFARLNGFQPFVRITQISRNGLHVPGLTGTQASFGVNVLSSLFQTTKESNGGSGDASDK